MVYIWNLIHIILAGRRFAEQEIYVVIMKLIQNFRLEWPHSTKMKQIYNMLLEPSLPADISFHKKITSLN